MGYLQGSFRAGLLPHKLRSGGADEREDRHILGMIISTPRSMLAVLLPVLELRQRSCTCIPHVQSPTQAQGGLLVQVPCEQVAGVASHAVNNISLYKDPVQPSPGFPSPLRQVSCLLLPNSASRGPCSAACSPPSIPTRPVQAPFGNCPDAPHVCFRRGTSQTLPLLDLMR